MMKKIISFIILINLSFIAGQYDDYTDQNDNSIYYFWPFQDPPFDSLDIFFNAPKCKASESNCTIKIIPCNMTCDPTINCTFFLSSCNNNSFESSPLNILKAFTISNDNIQELSLMHISYIHVIHIYAPCRFHFYRPKKWASSKSCF